MTQFTRTALACMLAAAAVDLVLGGELGSAGPNNATVNAGTLPQPTPVPAAAPKGSGELSAETVALFSAMALLGAVGVQATGFGMAIIYLTAYEIISAVGGFAHESTTVTLKLAVFVQAIALCSTLPFAIKAGAKWQDMRKSLLVPLVPATFAGTPCGQLLQARMDEDIVRVVLGATLLVACTLMLYKARASVRKLAAGCLGCGTTAAAHTNLGDTGDAITMNDDANATTAVAAVAAVANASAGKRGSYAMAIEQGTGLGACAAEGDEGLVATRIADAPDDNVGAIVSWRSVVLVAVGFTSGFLGGLVGARGPPLILFFLFTSYPRNVVRSNQIVVRTVNVSVRLLTYALVPPPADYAHGSGAGGGSVGWFNFERHWPLYVSVCACAIVGTVVGEVAFRRVTNKDVYKTMLAGLVLICAIGMLAKGTANLYA